MLSTGGWDKLIQGLLRPCWRGLTLHCLSFPEALHQYYRQAHTGLLWPCWRGLTLHCLSFPEALHQYYRQAHTRLALTLFTGTNIVLSLFSRSILSTSVPDRPRRGLLLPVSLLNCLVCVLEVFWEQAFQTGQNEDSISLFYWTVLVFQRHSGHRCSKQAQTRMASAWVVLPTAERCLGKIPSAGSSHSPPGLYTMTWHIIPRPSSAVHSDLTHQGHFLSCTQRPNIPCPSSAVHSDLPHIPCPSSAVHSDLPHMPCPSSAVHPLPSCVQWCCPFLAV